MRSSLLLSAVPFLACLQGTLGLFPKSGGIAPLELSEAEAEELASAAVPLTGNGTFDTYIDHTNPRLGTFKLRYWFNATLWDGPGSPVYFFTPGEIAADNYGGYLTERAVTGLYAKATKGAIIMLEHRYYGDSTPFADQTTKNLQYLTLDQSVADFVKVAKELKLPFDKSGKSNAPRAPWVWVGGSYSGALAAWVEKLSPGTFFAYHGSSGPVQAVYDYWGYFYPIQQGMPRNCSADFAAIVAHVDDVLGHGSPQSKASLKKLFAVDALQHDDDAANAISYPIYNWQSIQFDSGYSTFYQMCDAIEGFFPNSTAPTGYPTSGGVGLDKALANYAKWFTTSYIPGTCESYGYSDWAGTMNVQCWNTYNTSMEAFHDYSARSAISRPWVWQTCNDPFFYYQGGAGTPTGPSIYTRLVGPEYYQRQCEILFPQQGPYTYASKQPRPGKTAADINAHTDGWFNTKTTRLFVTNGQFDPWRSASVSSELRPGGPFAGTGDSGAQPVILIEGSRHCNDLNVRNAVHKPVADAQAKLVKQMTAWIGEFKGGHYRRAERGELGRN